VLWERMLCLYLKKKKQKGLFLNKGSRTIRILKTEFTGHVGGLAAFLIFGRIAGEKEENLRSEKTLEVYKTLATMELAALRINRTGEKIMEKLMLQPIGRVCVRDGETTLVLDKKYVPALAGLEGFSHVQVLWWFDGCDDETARSVLTVQKPYRNGPDEMGTFATRSPERPNPIALSCAFVTAVEQADGIVRLAYIDAHDGSPVLDIKPYTPSLDRVESPDVPAWCAHWPDSVEESGEFDWEAEFNF